MAVYYVHYFYISREYTLQFGPHLDDPFFGNLYFSCPKLFNTFSHILTSFFLHNCIHSIITAVLVQTVGRSKKIQINIFIKKIIASYR